MDQANKVPLPGCTPEPLMAYLKTLGVFRLVAEQADPDARLSWLGGFAHLSSNRDHEGLEKFFLETYKPTPIVGPWGARSGFYPASSESSARQALNTIVASSSQRLEFFRQTIQAVRTILDELGIRRKEDLDEGENYIRLLRTLRNELSESGPWDPCGAWLDAVFVLTNEDRKFPPLLGTGGNEGSGSYMSNFCQMVASLIVQRKADQGVAAALFAAPVAIRSAVTVGHFAPGAIGGPNSSVGFGGGGGANPWDFLLAIEGTLLFAGAAARRMGTDTGGKAAFPFTVNPTWTGYGTAASREDARAEMWMPEWSDPFTLDELKHLLAEGRAQLGRRQARSSVEFARATTTLGVNAGLTRFHRYSLVKRNGLSYFASYLGGFSVRHIPNAHLFDQLDSWLSPYRRLAEAGNAPTRFATAVHEIESTVMAVCRYGDSVEQMQAVLRAVGRAERELANGKTVRGDNPSLRPLTGLSSQWLEACYDGSAEFRLAASLAFMQNRPFRTYAEPVVLRGKRNWQFDDTAPGVVWSNADLSANLAAVLLRRLREGAAEEPTAADGLTQRSGHPLWGPQRFRPFLSDVLQFLACDTDDERLADLLWGLFAVDSNDRTFRFEEPTREGLIAPIDYALLKPVFLAETISRPGATITNGVRNEPRAAVLLQAGRLDEAVEVARRRLQVSGLPSKLPAPGGRVSRGVRDIPAPPNHARRLLAALLFPLRPRSINRLLKFAIRELKPQSV